MHELLPVYVNDAVVNVEPGSTVVAALMLAGDPCRISVSGEPRTALCGMGICLECRATVDGVPHRRTCQLLCQPGMRVETTR